MTLALRNVLSTETINALQAFRKRNADAKVAHAQVKDMKTDVGALPHPYNKHYRCVH